jgi:hypothetical protein
MPEAMDSTSSDEEHSSGLVSRYQIKLREPKVAIDLNEPAPAEEFPEFKVKVRTDKERIKRTPEDGETVEERKGSCRTMECQAARKDSGFQEEEKEQRALLKELREINFKLYWHNIVLTTKLKQKTAKATAVIIS